MNEWMKEAEWKVGKFSKLIRVKRRSKSLCLFRSPNPFQATHINQYGELMFVRSPLEDTYAVAKVKLLTAVTVLQALGLSFIVFVAMIHRQQEE